MQKLAPEALKTTNNMISCKGPWTIPNQQHHARSLLPLASYQAKNKAKSNQFLNELALPNRILPCGMFLASHRCTDVRRIACHALPAQAMSASPVCPRLW